MDRNILPYEEARFNTLLLRMTISNCWAFRWVENEEINRIFKFISPFLNYYQDKNYLAQSYNDSVKECQQEIENIAHADKIVVTISLDGWKNVLKQNILGWS
jgi:hypothetical protein